MQLTVADLRALPLSAALTERLDDVIASTPEWRGIGPGCVAYPVRNKRLLVATRPADGIAEALLRELLTLLDGAAASSSGEQSLRLRMLGASLHLLAGDELPTPGPVDDVIALALAGIAARTSARVVVEHAGDAIVPAPEVIALVLVQLAVNAQRHAGAESLQLEQRDDVFNVSWRSSSGGGRVTTSRRHADRRGWGLGFARIAADALGATVHPPHARDTRVVSTLELGVSHLNLPLAAVRRETVARATRTWDEETAALPGTHMASVPRLQAAVAAARAAPGTIVRIDGWTARRDGELTWVAIPPDDAGDRMLDVLDGLLHERQLLSGLDQRMRVHVHALSLGLGACLGRPVPRVPARAWLRDMHELSHLLPQHVQLPPFAGLGAVDPTLAVTLCSRAGARIEQEDDAMWLLVRPERMGDSLVQALVTRGENRIRLG